MEHMKLWEFAYEPKSYFRLGIENGNNIVELARTDMSWVPTYKQWRGQPVDFHCINQHVEDFEDVDTVDMNTGLYLDDRMAEVPETLPFILGALTRQGWTQVLIKMENIDQRLPAMKARWSDDYDFTEEDIDKGWRFKAFRPVIFLKKEKYEVYGCIHLMWQNAECIMEKVEECKKEAEQRNKIYHTLLDVAKKRIIELAKNCLLPDKELQEKDILAHAGNHIGLQFASDLSIVDTRSTQLQTHMGLEAIDRLLAFLKKKIAEGEGLRDANA